MNFIAIDFETATSIRNSVCEVGLAFVENNKITGTRSWLVKPKGNRYDPFNISIHGINPEDTANKPEFDIVWKEILPLIDGKTLVAHNAAFDMYVLRDVLDLYQLDYPDINTMCSYRLSKKAFPELISYNLGSLSQRLGIEIQEYHRAEDDAKACAEICIKTFKENEIFDFETLADKFRIIRGAMCKENRSFTPSHVKQIRDNRTRTLFDVKSIVGDTSKHDTENLFYKKSVVFTGTLSSMSRKDALQIIADIGGITSNSVNKTTNFLVVGQQDYRIVGDDGLSGKQEKALRLLEKGGEIEIISEDDFLKNVNSVKPSDALVDNDGDSEKNDDDDVEDNDDNDNDPKTYLELLRSLKRIEESIYEENYSIERFGKLKDKLLAQLVAEIQVNGAASDEAESLREYTCKIGASYQDTKNKINNLFQLKIKQERQLDKLRKK